MALPRNLARRELDRVADEVRDDLMQAEGFADELVGDVWVDVVVRSKLFCEAQTTSVFRIPKMVCRSE